MTFKQACEYFTHYVKENTDLPKLWEAGDEMESDCLQDEYPHVEQMANTLTIMEWGHRSRDEYVGIALTTTDITKSPFSVQVNDRGGVYHGHGSMTLTSAMEIASVCMFMLNHSADTRVTEAEVERLRHNVEALEEQTEALANENSELRSKNNTLRSQMGTLIETATSGYEEGNWHNMVSKPQSWRPPNENELIRLAEHIDRYWYDNEPMENDGVSDHAKNLVSESYMIVLEGWSSVVSRVEDKALFMLHNSDGLFGLYLFNDDDQGMKEVKQRPQMLAEDSDNSVVVSFGDDR